MHGPSISDSSSIAAADGRAEAKDFAEATRLGRQALGIAGVLRSSAVREIQGKIRRWTALANLARQTSLDFEKDMRPFDVWLITEIGDPNAEHPGEPASAGGR